jgi:hypothetical protein
METDIAPFAIHATAVAIGDLALVIRGPSKAGKSTLALQLIAASGAGCPIMLIGDDRLLVSRRGREVIVAPHPRIAGLIEKRGDGILAMAYRAQAVVGAIVGLGSTAPKDGDAPRCDLAGNTFPYLRFVKDGGWNARHARVLEWFVATSVAHRDLKCGMNLLHA